MMMSASVLPTGGKASQQQKSKVPPFLKKLVDLTNSCPPHIGGWNEDGTQFVVKSSQFADLLREQFQGSLQTFVRQLHFYSFNKKDDGAKGIWMFSHPSFIRGQPHLLVNIERKSNPKKKGGKDDDDSDSYPAPKQSPHGTSPVRAFSDPTHTSSYSFQDNRSAEIAALTERVAQTERKLERMTALEQEILAVKQELVHFKELAAAQNLLSLAPEISKKRIAKEEPLKEKEDPLKEKEDPLLHLAPPRKVTRLTSVDSVFEMKDFPFEDTSSLGSVSVRDLMRELQYGIFADFDEFLPTSASKFSSMEASVPATPANTTETTVVQEPTPGQFCGQNKEEMFKIPNGFELQPGVTIPLLKQAFCVIAKMCCPKNGYGECSEALKRLCDEHPHPSTLPPVELCPISQELLPVLRENVQDEASDLALMRAARQVYEVYYHTMMRKLQDKMDAPANSSSSAAAGGCESAKTPGSNASSQ